MKTRAILSASFLVLGFLAWLLISSCQTASSDGSGSEDVKHNVIFQDDGTGIVIPGTEISNADGEKMNAILKKYDKEIYQLKTYENAKLEKTAGSLEDLFLDKELRSEMAANVGKPGFAHFAIQLGVCNWVLHHPAGPSATPVSGVARAQHIKASKELVTELKPILDKYRRK